MIYPTVHLNGTSKEELQRQLRDAHEAIGKAIEAMAQAAPHGRDYYPQGSSVIYNAQAEHTSRVRRLESVREELFAIWENIENNQR